MPKKIDDKEEEEKIEIPVRQEPDINAMIVETYTMVKKILQKAEED